MGGHPYWYFVPHEDDAQAALDRLRARELAAGRYYPVLSDIKFAEPGFAAQTPGAQHATIEEAMEDAAETGTRSILDIASVGDERDFCTAARLGDDELRARLGTPQPTREQILAGLLRVLEGIERGKAVYAAVYRDGAPAELFFAGYSYD